MTAAGTPIHLDFRKWDGQEHWQEPSIYLGEDEHGRWVYVPTGTISLRPGARFETVTDAVRLIPEAPHLMIVNGPRDDPRAYNVYVDVITVPKWVRTPEGWTVRSVDLDLDVIRRYDGEIFIDDEDEFADHQVQMGYPADVIALAEGSCAQVLREMRTGHAPYDEQTAARWFARGRALSLS